jgi:hypothetical protein
MLMRHAKPVNSLGRGFDPHPVDSFLFKTMEIFIGIVGGLFILGLFLFSIYELPRRGYRIQGKRFTKNRP